ncbi:putative 1-pyrroline-5-carboxylate dehydrogenase [Irpex rosettiformis]|uniref:1-pyrroline-5-carboxylate dehydrogenase n=1 Tax=Irpex rosettiformis TaxID=378272 RepID=A0ACB8U0W3_9APHY|nr:putative 1-pyrroline-5-carboxylate dehydrogenase [Irpex rosettiformis]
MTATYTHTFDTPVYKGTVSVNTGLFINGKFVEPVLKQSIETVNPVTGEVIAKVSAGTSEDVDIAVAAAKKAFKSSWGLKVPGHQRGRMLGKLADLIEEHKDELAALESLDTGKLFLHTSKFEVPTAVQVSRYFAGWADKNYGQTIETDESKFAYTRHEPIGVVAAIAPWNYPLLTSFIKVVTALATGNTVVVKPSEVTPLSILKVAEYFNAAGFPPGVVNIVNGYGQTVGQALADHRDIGKLTFTGSTLVGRKIMESAAKTNLKRVTLELGGKSPTLVFDDADLQRAVTGTVLNIFHNSGQMCTAGSRIYVQEGIYDRFVEAFAAAARGIKVGNGFDGNCDQGPLVSEIQMKRVLGYVESGKAEGAKVLTGGSRQGDKGFFVPPTIFVNTTPDMKIVREEIFGPVCMIIKFKTEEEAIEHANDTEYGLSCQVFSQDISRALRVAHALEAGQALINGIGGGVGVPFGGIKQSGFGKELGQHALEAFTTVKAVHVNL